MPRKRPAVTTLNVRGIAAPAVERIKLSAHARGLTVGAYLERLERLHAEARALAGAESGPLTPVTTVLISLGLEPVTR